MSKMDDGIKRIIGEYRNSFSEKTYSDENNETDILMQAFNISPELKRENRQYWGRELGMAWQRIVIEIFKNNHPQYSPALRFGGDEPCDLVAGKDAIDTKYRVGSGDSGTLKKFKQYGEMLRNEGYRPVFLMLRSDNLNAAITACKTGGWTVLTGKDSFKYILDNTGVDIEKYLKDLGSNYHIKR
ncbi:hypothetical protein ACOAOT_19540 [Lacrimispora sp. AGF001]|uniref:hypothetical protein n=1 Tax=Lacrimispora sp. AGF001 TaxID=3401631 RepID=UPI003B430E89